LRFYNIISQENHFCCYLRQRFFKRSRSPIRNK